MSAYDSFLDAEYDRYCNERDLAERDFLQEELAELEMQARETVASLDFYTIELGKAMDARIYEKDEDDIRSFIEYDKEELKKIAAKINELEEELAYLRY